MSEPTAEKTNLSNTRVTDKEELEEIVVFAGVHDEGGVLAVVKGGGETVMESQRVGGCGVLSVVRGLSGEGHALHLFGLQVHCLT